MEEVLLALFTLLENNAGSGTLLALAGAFA
jgi:hypothetical protein